MDATPNKSGWDKRAWKVGFLWGNFFGITHAVSIYHPIRHQMDAILTIHFLGMTGGNIFSLVFGLGSLVVMPIILSITAHRRTFLWGLLPIALFYFWIEIESIFDTALDSFWKETLEDIPAMLVIWVLIPGPISLYRYSRVRAERKRLAMQALFDAQREAMSIEQPGVWPPPPNYTGENRS